MAPPGFLSARQPAQDSHHALSFGPTRCRRQSPSLTRTLVFYQQGNLPKARSWLERTIKCRGGEDIGDAWAVWYKLESEHGGNEIRVGAVCLLASEHESVCRDVIDEMCREHEIRVGTPQAALDIAARCKAADPHHGELWPQTAKEPTHWAWTTDQILTTVAARFRLDSRAPIDALYPAPLVPPPLPVAPPKQEEPQPKAEPGVVVAAPATAIATATATATSTQPTATAAPVMAPPPPPPGRVKTEPR
ncbi:hypothetical protein PAPYR_12597 [Paratrimastix pyriformis]|uniref:Uncharacterized protein n=1 Tax=Paratrimastix pyriformis TaxID=342808 RepID=A0ABQ8U1M0_9EUKA|nr:hypothetical protein PAPYR_12597 [Paratrimastix pyriformis]